MLYQKNSSQHKAKMFLKNDYRFTTGVENRLQHFTNSLYARKFNENVDNIISSKISKL